MKTATSSRKTQQASEWSNFVTKTPSLSLCLASKVPPPPHPHKGNQKSLCRGSMERWHTCVLSISVKLDTVGEWSLPQLASLLFLTVNTRPSNCIIIVTFAIFFSTLNKLNVRYDGCRFSETPPPVMTSRNLTVLITGAYKSRDKECWSVQSCWFWKSKPGSNWFWPTSDSGRQSRAESAACEKLPRPTAWAGTLIQLKYNSLFSKCCKFWLGNGS